MKSAWKRGCAAVALCCGAMMSSSATGAITDPDGILEAMEVREGVIQKIPHAGALGAQIDFSFVMDEEIWNVTMTPQSVRSPDYQLFVDNGEELIPTVPGQSRTYRGFVHEVDAALVAGSLMEDGLRVMILAPDGKGADRAIFIQPSRSVNADAPLGEYVIYEQEDVIFGDHVCGVGLQEDAPVENAAPAQPASGDAVAAACCDAHAAAEGEIGNDVGGVGTRVGTRDPFIFEALLALDADFEYYLLNGSNVAATEADMENIINLVNVAYERDAEITHLIGTVIVRSNSNDPYTSASAGTRLSQFENHWRTVQSSVPRDVAHLFTGINLTGSTIGIANLGGICSFNNQYGLSQARFSGNLNSRVALVAHEQGHLWNATHCNSSGNSNCDIMCSGLGGCGGFGLPNFETPATNQIVAFRNSRTCLTVIDLDPTFLPLPLTENWDLGFIFDAIFPTSTGAQVVFNPPGATPPSGGFVLELDTFDEIITEKLLIADVGGPVDIAFELRADGVSGIDQLIVEIDDDNGTLFTVLDQILESDLSAGGAAYKQFVIPVPSGDLVNGRRVKIRALTFSSGAKWYLDDLYIGEELIIAPTACNPADLNTATASTPVSPGWGDPDGILTPTDFTAFVNFFSTGDLRADINTASAASPAFPNFGVPDGVLSPTDFSAFAAYFGAGCPCTLPGCP